MNPTDVTAPMVATVPDAPVVQPIELPTVMDVPDMMRTFRVSRSYFYKLNKLGRFKDLEFKPQLSKRKKWSGVKVAAYLRGERVK